MATVRRSKMLVLGSSWAPVLAGSLEPLVRCWDHVGGTHSRANMLAGHLGSEPFTNIFARICVGSEVGSVLRQ